MKGLCGGSKTVQRKLVLLCVSSSRTKFVEVESLTNTTRGDGASGKTSLLNVFTRGYAITAETMFK